MTRQRKGTRICITARVSPAHRIKTEICCCVPCLKAAESLQGQRCDVARHSVVPMLVCGSNVIVVVRQRRRFPKLPLVERDDGWLSRRSAGADNLDIVGGRRRGRLLPHVNVRRVTAVGGSSVSHQGRSDTRRQRQRLTSSRGPSGAGSTATRTTAGDAPGACVGGGQAPPRCKGPAV